MFGISVVRRSSKEVTHTMYYYLISLTITVWIILFPLFHSQLILPGLNASSTQETQINPSKSNTTGGLLNDTTQLGVLGAENDSSDHLFNSTTSALKPYIISLQENIQKGITLVTSDSALLSSCGNNIQLYRITAGSYPDPTTRLTKSLVAINLFFDCGTAATLTARSNPLSKDSTGYLKWQPAEHDPNPRSMTMQRIEYNFRFSDFQNWLPIQMVEHLLNGLSIFVVEMWKEAPNMYAPYYQGIYDFCIWDQTYKGLIKSFRGDPKQLTTVTSRPSPIELIQWGVYLVELKDIYQRPQLYYIDARNPLRTGSEIRDFESVQLRFKLNDVHAVSFTNTYVDESGGWGEPDAFLADLSQAKPFDWLATWSMLETKEAEHILQDAGWTEPWQRLAIYVPYRGQFPAGAFSEGEVVYLFYSDAYPGAVKAVVIGTIHQTARPVRRGPALNTVENGTAGSSALNPTLGAAGGATPAVGASLQASTGALALPCYRPQRKK